MGPDVLMRSFVDLTDVSLADEDAIAMVGTNSILNDDANEAIPSNI